MNNFTYLVIARKQNDARLVMYVYLAHLLTKMPLTTHEITPFQMKNSEIVICETRYSWIYGYFVTV